MSRKKPTYKELEKRVRDLEKAEAERKQAAERLQYFRKAVEGATDAIGMSTPDGRHYYQNETFTELFGGITTEEVDGASGPPSTIYADEAVGREVFNTIMNGGTWTGEVKMIDKGGRDLDVFLRAYSIKDENGKVIGLVGVHNDITERKRAEKAQRESETELHHKASILEAQLDSTLDGILIVNNQGEKILQNRRTVELWNIPQHIADNPDDEIQVQHVMHMTKNPEQFVEKVTYIYNHPDETTRDEVELTNGTVLDRYSAPVLGKDGKNYGRIWTFRDITERKRTEEEVKKERDRAQNYLDLAGVMFVAINIAGEVTLINKKGCEILGYDEGEILGKNWFENFVPERIREAILPISKKLLNGEIETAEYYENPILNKRGEERLIAWHNSILRDDQGNIVAHLSSGEDVTERKRAEEALQLTQFTLDRSVDAAFWVTSEAEFIYLNEAASRLVGYTNEELLSMMVHDIDKSYSKETWPVRYKEIIERGASPFETNLLR
ncbi:PAS domain-containing protein, partial [Gemmatimonadota bacterium]